MLLNQLKCDLKFVLWALVALVLLAPVQVWLELREFENFERGLDLGLALSGWLWVLMMMVSVVAVVLVVQKDTPAGPREFWLSRPVSRETMFGSKLLIFGLFLAVLGTVWLMAPFLSGNKELGGLLLLSFVNHSAWVLALALVLSVISSGVPQVLQNGLMMGFLVIVVAFFQMNFFEAGFPPRPYEVGQSASLVARVVFIFGAIALVIWFYWAKSSKKGLQLVIALFFLSLGVILFWSVNLMADKMSKTVNRESGWDSVTVKLELREKDIERYQRNSSSGIVNGVKVRRIPCSGLLANLPEGYSVRNIAFSGDFEVNGKSMWSSPEGRSVISTYLPSDALTEYESLESVDEGRLFGNLEGQRRLRVARLTLAGVPESELKQWRGKSISYRGQARVEAVKTVRIARFQFGEDVVLDTHGMRMKVAFKGEGENPSLFQIEGQAWYPRPFYTAWDYQGMRLFLVNEKEKSFFEVSRDRAGSGPRGRVSYWDMEFELTRWGWEKVLKKLPNREEWLSESFFYLYAPISQGEFVVPVALEDFRLEDVMGPLE